MTDVGSDLAALVEQAKTDIAQVTRVFRETGTVAASGVGFFLQRVPGAEKFVAAAYKGAWDLSPEIRAAVVGFDGTVLSGASHANWAAPKFAEVFRQHPAITAMFHFHPPYLSAWSAAHRPFPIYYVPAQRFTLAREIPVYIDATQSEASFILAQLRENPHTPAILEANGGATFWGDGILKTAQFALFLEEGARLQTLAVPLGGAKEFGPGVLEEEWGRAGLLPR